MKILYINHYAGSPRHGMSFRTYYLAREWVRAGHEVTVVAASWSHLRQVQPEVPGLYKKELIDGISYLWLSVPPYQDNGGGRIFNILSFLRRLSTLPALLSGERFDAVIASSTYPYDNYIAHSLSKRWKAVHIFEVHDLWPLSPKELGGYSSFHPFIVATQIAEDYGYRQADSIVSLIPAAEPYMRSRGLQSGKFHTVPNGIDLDEWREAIPLPDGVQETIRDFKQGRFMVAYAGGHGISNALESFVDAAAMCPEYAFVLAGKGPEKERLCERARSAVNVLFLDPVPKACVPSLLAEMDALFLGWRRSPLYAYGISPNKLFDYMMAAKPIIHAVDAANDPCADARCGISIEPESAQAIADALKAVNALSFVEREQMGLRGRAYVLRNHEYSVLAAHFLSIITETIIKKSEKSL